MPNCHFEVIDYVPTYVRRRRRSFVIVKRPPFVWPRGNHRIRRSQDRFYEEYVRFSPRLAVDDSIEAARRAILDQRYDAVVVGSDTVWDSRPNTGVPQVPNVFSLPGFEGVVKTSFAASMDKGGPRHVSPRAWQRLIDEIADFDYISVRDEATRLWLGEGGLPLEKVHFMPDPTILHDFSDIANLPKRFRDEHPNLAAVAVSDPRLQVTVTRQLVEMGYEVINLLCSPVEGQLSAPADWSYGERVGAHACFQAMITDRFHGSIFALKQNPKTPVLLVEPSYYYEDSMSKGRDLFTRLGLSPMVWRYEANQPIPEDLVERSLAKHAGMAIDVPEKILALRSDAAESIRNLVALLD
jgi:hypothetical protein